MLTIYRNAYIINIVLKARAKNVILQYGGLPKWLKGPVLKTGRS